MNKKIIFFGIIIIIVLGLIFAAYFISNNKKVVGEKPVLSSSDAKYQLLRQALDKSQQEQLDQFKRDHAQIVTGKITFYENNKTTITGADGKEYILWPAQPQSIYELMGIKSGQIITMQGKFLDGGRIEGIIIK